ncbi:MAG: DUF881 domain-containing protein [Micromonosporaceae bacterium]|nr:DUF881 domain-containing protein [Micromonosporaceae bacterium]
MTDEQTDQPQPPAEEPSAEPAPEPEVEAPAVEAEVEAAAPEPAGRRRVGGTRLVVALLLGLLGFTFAIQVRSVADDPTVAALGEEDLVRILANLDAHEERLQQDIRELQETSQRLRTTGESQQEALAEAARRADELGILAGTLPAEGPGVTVTLRGAGGAVTADTLLDAVQELRGAGGEAIQVQGADRAPVRVVASSYFVDGPDGIVVDGRTLRGPYTLVVIGEPETLTPALHIPGGVVESVQQDGGTVTVHEEPGGVEVSAVRQPEALQHARPDS